MEYCPHSNLQTIVEMTLRASEQNGYVFPEPALWSIFDDLVDACLLLQYGGTKEEDAKQDWKPIVHRDMKLDNVLLDIPSARDDFPSYPTAKLTDFGEAIMTNDDDPNNPMAYNNVAGADDWRAPEQMLYVNANTYQVLKAEKLGEKTNVWGLGAIMIRLMNLGRLPGEPDFEDGKPGQLEVKEEWNGSAALVDIVERCARFDLKDRPRLRELKSEILGHTSGSEIDLARGKRTQWIAEDEEEDLVLRYPQPEYVMNMVLP